MSIMIKKCTIEDLKALKDISIQTFDDTFRAKNKPENVDAYLKNTFQVSLLEKELKHSESEFYFIFYDNQVAGYLKLNTFDAQTEQMGHDSLEIERLYLLSSFQKKGLGDKLMNFSFSRAKELNKRSIWLGVWEKNANAIAFYKKYGFEKVDAHFFYMGDEEQVDWILVTIL